MTGERTASAATRDICERVARDEPVRETLPPAGSIYIDGLKPFLCVYRSPPDRPDAGTKDLVTTEAAYLFATGEEEHRPELVSLCLAIARLATRRLGAFLLVEIWSNPGLDYASHSEALPAPGFRIFSTSQSPAEVVAALEAELSSITFCREASSVTTEHVPRVAPPGLEPLATEGSPAAFHSIGIQIDPVFRQGETLFPDLLRDLRAQFSRALRRGLHTFARREMHEPPEHFHHLGGRHLFPAAQALDERVSSLAETFDFLLQVTPVNVESAWSKFRSDQYLRRPTFHYRPLPHGVEHLKRQLFEIPVHHIDDPTLGLLLQEKQSELDRQLTALRDVGTSRFLYASLQLYGKPDAALQALAREVFDAFPNAQEPPPGRRLVASEIVAAAGCEISHYQLQAPEFAPLIEVRSDIASSLAVSGGRLLVSQTAEVPAATVEALFQHEIGTHLLTQFNGSQQGLAMLGAGLADYERLQEGLAVLNEHLASPILPNRSRTLAGRVLATHWVAGGAEFIDVFDRLHQDLGFTPRPAFMIAARVFRGGGFTKDLIYLQGLSELATYLNRGRCVEQLRMLYAGKFALRHLPFIDELLKRGLVNPPRLLPRNFSDGLASRGAGPAAPFDVGEVLTGRASAPAASRTQL